jgi:D-sedoheptulose 7-phosphate isomerase
LAGPAQWGKGEEQWTAAKLQVVGAVDLWARIQAKWAATEATLGDGSQVDTLQAVMSAGETLRDVHRDASILFIGNGGSQAIASHAATDFHRHLGRHCDTPSSVSYLTAATNDFSYAMAFERWVHSAARPGSVLIAVSSSGQSENIVQATRAAVTMGVTVMTLSGFKPDNPLRQLGDLRVYVPSDQYQVVEAIHHIWLCQCLEVACGYEI